MKKMPPRTILKQKIYNFMNLKGIKTIYELAEKIKTEKGINVSGSTIKRYMYSKKEDNMDTKKAIMEYCDLTIGDFERQEN